MRPTLDINLLRTFHAIARLGQFRAAAAFVHRSPAAVSVHIQRLEQVVGGRLLERDNQSVVLTPLGEKLLASTLGLLNAHDDILRELQGAPLSGHIKLGVPDEYASHVMRDVLPAFATRFPAVMLEVSTAASQALVEQIGRNRLQLALAVLPMGTAPDAACGDCAGLGWRPPVGAGYGPTDTIGVACRRLPLPRGYDRCIERGGKALASGCEQPFGQRGGCRRRGRIGRHAARPRTRDGGDADPRRIAVGRSARSAAAALCRCRRSIGGGDAGKRYR